MNLFFCAWRPSGEPLRKSELFAQLAQMPRDRRYESITEGPFAAVFATDDHTMRPLSARYRNLIAVGDVRLDDRAEIECYADALPRPASDLELVLAAVDARGTEIIEKLVGDFGFVIWDARAQKLVAARDAFGVKSLFLRNTNDLVLASSRASVLADPSNYDREYLAQFLYGAEQQNRTVWAGVEALSPGVIRQQRGTVPAERRFWDAAGFEPGEGGDEREQVQRFGELFRDAVHSRLDEPTRTWSQLSGGLDSSSVVCVAEQERFGSLPRLGGTVTVVDSLGDGDETPYSDLVVEQHGLRNEKVVDYWPWREEESGPPVTDQPHPLYSFYARDNRVCDVVRSAGGRVLLSGFGSDHYLFGNLSYIPDLVMAGRVIGAMRELAQWSIAGRVSFWRAARAHIVRPLVQRRTITSGAPELPAWLGTIGHAAVRQRLAALHDAPAPRGRMFAATTARALSGVHAWIERGPFQEGLEMRYPFLHRPLVEYSLRLPVHMRIRPYARKWVLREAMRDVLPERIRTRIAKGGIDARIMWAFQKEKNRLDQLVEEPLLADLGLIDANALRRAVEDTRCGGQQNLVLLMSALSLETWLAAREGRFSIQRKAA